MTIQIEQAQKQAKDRVRFAHLSLEAAKRAVRENPDDEVAATALEAAKREAEDALAVGREMGL